MKTPYLDEKIKVLEDYKSHTPLSLRGESMLIEYKSIKTFIETHKNSPIVSTSEKPVWVVDEYGDKCILLTDLGDKVIDNRFIVIPEKHQDNFLQGKSFIYNIREFAIPYTPKINIEVTEEEAVKVEEFLKTLRK